MCLHRREASQAARCRSARVLSVSRVHVWRLLHARQGIRVVSPSRAQCPTRLGLSHAQQQDARTVCEPLIADPAGHIREQIRNSSVIFAVMKWNESMVDIDQDAIRAKYGHGLARNDFMKSCKTRTLYARL